MGTEGETIKYMTMTVAEITNSPTEDDLTGKLVQITGIPAGTSLNTGTGFQGYMPDKEYPHLLMGIYGSGDYIRSGQVVALLNAATPDREATITGMIKYNGCYELKVSQISVGNITLTVGSNNFKRITKNLT